MPDEYIAIYRSLYTGITVARWRDEEQVSFLPCSEKLSRAIARRWSRVFGLEVVNFLD